jgi:hypothetical protein
LQTCQGVCTGRLHFVKTKEILISLGVIGIIALNYVSFFVIPSS